MPGVGGSLAVNNEAGFDIAPVLNIQADQFAQGRIYPRTKIDQIPGTITASFPD